MSVSNDFDILSDTGLGLTKEEVYLISPFFTNLDRGRVYAIRFLPPELVGALCSRASRSQEDLRIVFLNEFVKPYLNSGDEHGKSFIAFADLIHEYSAEQIFSNPKARDFYIKWLADYGDDSILQVYCVHVVLPTCSQVAIKFLQSMRIGVSAIEQSTRYMDFGHGIYGDYPYFTDPGLAKYGLHEKYREVMDMLFDTYSLLQTRYLEMLKLSYPTEKESTLVRHAYDVARAILPMSTQSQVAFCLSGQAAEHMIHRCRLYNLNEIREVGDEIYKALRIIALSLVRRAESPTTFPYHEYYANSPKRVKNALKRIGWDFDPSVEGTGVKLIGFDPDGEDKIVASLIYQNSNQSFDTILNEVKKLTPKQKLAILTASKYGRMKRWFKIPRAFEALNLTLEITCSLAEYRDLMRHRILTEIHHSYSAQCGFDVPKEFVGTELEQIFVNAVEQVNSLFAEIKRHDPQLAQYSTTMAHRISFVWMLNFRELVHILELRTDQQGHSKYRQTMFEIIKLVRKSFPLVSRYLLVDTTNYTFARRGTKERVESRRKRLR